MKESHAPAEKSSVGFMFACVARGVHVHGGREGVESALFRKHFPHTPLLGFFGNGEIGVDNLSSDDVSVAGVAGAASAAKKARPSCLYSYATTVVIVSFPD